jgi:leader peptidase (prepilin peptidase)/N-methyltransferase
MAQVGPIRDVAENPQVSLFAASATPMTAFQTNRTAASFAALRTSEKIVIATVAAGSVVVSAMVAPPAVGALGGALAILMLAVAVTDARFYIIPDALTAIAFVLGLVHAGLQRPEIAVEAVAMAVLRAAILALAFLALRVAYRWWRGREGMGLGDIKLAGLAGAWLDWSIIPLAINIAALSALAVYAFRQFVLRRRLYAAARLPFGVFLSPAIWLSWLFATAL